MSDYSRLSSIITAVLMLLVGNSHVCDTRPSTTKSHDGLDHVVVSDITASLSLDASADNGISVTDDSDRTKDDYDDNRMQMLSTKFQNDGPGNIHYPQQQEYLESIGSDAMFSNDLPQKSPGKYSRRNDVNHYRTRERNALSNNDVDSWYMFRGRDDETDSDFSPSRDRGNAIEDYDNTFGDFGAGGDAAYGTRRAPPGPPRSSDHRRTQTPQYMLDIYNKFSNKRYTSPVFNIVRSFVNIDKDSSHSGHLRNTKNKTRVHRLMFNITSLSRDEDINLAEIRLYTLVENDRNAYNGVNRKVSVYQVISKTDSSEPKSRLLSSKRIYGRNSGWETFQITTAMQRWLHVKAPFLTLEVRIESMLSRNGFVDLDINTVSTHNNEPLLIIYSNERKKRKLMAKEIHEMITHEMKAAGTEETESATSSSESTNKKHNKNKTDKDVLSHAHHHFIARNKTMMDRMTEKRKLLNSLSWNTALRHSFSNSNTSRTMRTGRYKRRAKRYRRNICRRKSMYVNFKDILWDSWIIAPQGYEAYECTGRCFYPLGDYLTPTKHAIIQTLLHANGQRVSRTCCVPTKLEPISILYYDQRNVLTYKYKYDGMVVAECGCR